jgi:hypothetical protein
VASDARRVVPAELPELPARRRPIRRGTEHDIRTTGATIRAVTGGKGPPLLLVHGHPETHVIWHKVAPALAADFTVVVPDLRGYGDSSKSADACARYAAGHSNPYRDEDERSLELARRPWASKPAGRECRDCRKASTRLEYATSSLPCGASVIQPPAS